MGDRLGRLGVGWQKGGRKEGERKVGVGRSFIELQLLV